NYPRIKGNHTAMKTGMLAAESIFDALARGSSGGEDLADIETRLQQSWVHQELFAARNVAPAMHRFGMLLGSVFSFFDYGVLRGKLPLTRRDDTPDHACLKPAADCVPIAYPKADGVIT